MLIAALQLGAADSLVTGRDLNGRGWLNAEGYARSMYVSGVQSALHNFPSDNGQLVTPAHMTVGEMCAALERFYAEPENLPVPVVFALGIVTAKAAGTDPATVEKMAATLRRIASETAAAPAPR